MRALSSACLWHNYRLLNQIDITPWGKRLVELNTVKVKAFARIYPKRLWSSPIQVQLKC